MCKGSGVFDTTLLLGGAGVVVLGAGMSSRVGRRGEDKEYNDTETRIGKRHCITYERSTWQGEEGSVRVRSDIPAEG